MQIGRTNRKRLILLIVSAYLTGAFGSVYAAEDIYKGHVESQGSIKNEHNELYTGTTDNLKSKDILKMTVSKVLDGNNTKENDEFFAEVIDDVEGNGGVLIPKGTVAHGYVKRAVAAKNFGRNGLLDLNFDYLITPDGKEIPINGKMSTRLHPAKEASEMLVTNLAYTTAGGVTGGLMALTFAGIAGTVSSQGAIIAGGAAIGGSAGLAVALSNKGKNVSISPGDEILVKVYTNSKLPVYKKTAFPQKELINKDLKVQVNDIIYKKNSYDEVDKIVLSLSIDNMTSKPVSTFDVALVNDSGTTYYPDVFDEEKPFKGVQSGEKFKGEIPFSVDNVKNKFWLTFYDNKTREVISEISIDNAYKTVSDKTHKQNEKILKKKKDFYKDYNPFVD